VKELRISVEYLATTYGLTLDAAEIQDDEDGKPVLVLKGSPRE
jgi:hypothetical protein